MIEILVLAIPTLIIILIFILTSLKSKKVENNEKTLQVSNYIKKSSIDLNAKSIEGIMSDVKYKFTPRQFEYFCTYLFEELGHKSEITAASNDYGRDIILDDGKILVECKKYISDMVGREICQKLLGAVVHDKSEKGIIINTGRYHINALNYAKEVNNLELWDFIDIKSKLNSIGNEKALNIFYKTLNTPIEE